MVLTPQQTHANLTHANPPNSLLEIAFVFPSHFCAFENHNLADRPLKLIVYFMILLKTDKNIWSF